MSRRRKESTSAAPADPSSGRPRAVRTELILSVGLAVLTLIAFYPAGANGFVNLDDEDYVVANPHVTTGLTGDNVAWAFGTFHSSNWHPLTWLSLQIDASLWKTPKGTPDPAGFHRTNVLLHVANAVLLFLALSRLTGAAWSAAVVAALFAVHPLRAESVAWVAERKDVLSSAFGFAALLAYASYAAAPSWRRMAIVAGLFALSLMAKAMWVTFPFVLLLLDWWPLGRLPAATPGERAFRRARAAWPLVREKAPLFLLTALSCVATWAAQRTVAASSLELVPLDRRLANAVVSYVDYLRQTAWPTGLVAFYPLPKGALSAGHVAAAAGVLLAITAFALWQARRRPYLAVGWFWYLGTLVPMIGLVQVGAQARADRYTYLPGVGIAIAVVFGLDELAGRLRVRAAALAAAGVVVGLLTWRCQEQVRVWCDDRTLWTHAREAVGDTWMSRYGMGVAHERAGEFDQAIDDYQEAIHLHPKKAALRARLGTLLHGLRRYGEARECYEGALAIDPNYAQAHANLGAVFRTLGEPGQALGHLQEAVRLEPNNPESAVAYFNLGAVQQKLGAREEAAASYRQAVRLDPKLAGKVPR